MRVLWVKVGGLWPLNTGGRQRTFHMLSALARRHQVTLVTTHDPTDDHEGLRRAFEHGEGISSIPFRPPKQGSVAFAGALLRSWMSPLPVDLWKWRSREVRGAVSEAIRRASPDVIVGDFLVGMHNVPAQRHIPVVHFAHNVEYQIWKRLRDTEQNWLRRVVLDIEWRKMRAAEARACKRAAMTVAVSVNDRDRLAADAPGATVVDLPTGVDIEYFRPSQTPESPASLVFSGTMDWYPNEDAVLHFIGDVLPLVRRRRPDVTLTVVGRQPSERLRAAAAGVGVTVTGTVKDVRPHVASAALSIVPLRIGGGTRIKIFEALAMGKAVVSTTIGAEGLAVEDGRHLVLADGPAAFSDAVVSLLNDDDRRRALAAEGRRLVEEKYSWIQVTRIFEGFLEQARQR